MKKIIKNTLLILLFLITVLTIKNSSAKAATYGHYRYEEKNDGTITITKYDGTAANNLVIPSTINGKSVTSIGYYAFGSCSGLTGNLVIPDSVTSIGDSAFSRCRGFTGNLVIPDSVTSIGDSAFKGCSGLTGNLVIPNSVTSIGSSAFYECSGFTGNLVIPNSVTSIGNSAFMYCSSLTGNLTIPNSVTSIGYWTFLNCSGFTGNLVIPDSVTSIGDSAFKNCSGLTGNLTIGNSVTSIGDSAFYDCSGFTGNLVIPDSVTSIGDSAFANCSGFTGSLTIPDSVTSIGDGAFAYCKGLTNFYVGQNNVNYSSLDDILYSKDKTTIIQCLAGKTGELTVPDSVTSIGKKAFCGCSGLTGNLTIPDSVTSIGDSAFYNCSGLTGNLTIPDSVTSIGDGAFEYCSGFTGNLTIGKSVTSIGNSVFYKCSGFTGNLVIPDSVTSIGLYAFMYCSSLTGNLTIGKSVTSIGSDAFYMCSNLKGNLVIPDSVTSIGEDAFYDCSGFTGNLVIPDSVTSIGNSAFSGCSGFTGNLTIGKSVTSIGNSVFYECSGFTGNLVIPDSVTSIEKYAFSGCSGFTGNLTIPDSVTSIGKYAFANCKGLTNFYVGQNNVNYSSLDGILYSKDKTTIIQCLAGKTGELTIPDSVTSIGNGAFRGCSDLTGNLVIPDSVTNIGGYAFEGCSGFTGTLTIGKSVTSIGHRAFSECSSLTGNLTIPDSVTSIEEYAFCGCSGFTGNLTIGNSVTSIGDCVFEDCSGFTGNLVIPDSVTSIGWSAFSGCSGFTGTLTIGKSITSIDVSAFSKCSSLSNIYVDQNNVDFSSLNGILYNKDKTKIIKCPIGKTGELTIPDSVTSIGKKAFYNCSGLTGNLVIPDSVTSIGEDAFYDCSGFTGTLTIGNSVTSIGSRAFAYCSGLTGNLVIPDSVTSMEQNVFFMCKKIDKIVFVGAAPTIVGNGSQIGIRTFNSFNNKIYYRKGTTGYTAANDWPTDQLVQYTEALKKTNYTINELLSGASRPKIELDSTLSPLVTATFDVADTNIISISKSGNVGYITPLNNGTTEVTVNLKYSDSVVRTLKANVTVDIKVTNLNLDKTSYSFSTDKSGQSVQLNATVLPEKANNKVLNWTSSNTNIATVDSTGKVTTVGNSGECVITATTTDGTNIKATCNIKVPKMVKEITFDKSKYTITNDTPIDIIATVKPSDAENSKLDWTSSDTTKIKIDSVSSDTKQIAVSKVGNSGKYTITATAKDGSGVKASCEVEVNIPPTKVSIDKTEYKLSNLGDNVTLKATITPSEAYQTVTWTSSNTNIATVDSTGKVTAIAPGECDIIATSTQNSSLKSNCKIKVEEVKVTSITLNKTSYTFTDRTPLQLVATILPENATNKEVTWETTAPDKLSVDSTGKVTPIQNKVGGMIIARAKDGSGKAAACNITVDIPDKYISLNKSECTLKGIGESVNLTARIYPSSMSQEVNWTSSNTNIATVDGTGKVTSVGIGTCVITATSKGDSSLKASCNITVEEVKVTSITLNKTSYTFTDRTPLQLVATILPENATNKEVTWETTAPGKLSVDSTGKVTPSTNQGGGMIIARAKDGSGKVATCNITIDIPNKYISLNKSECTLKGIGESTNLTATINPSSMSQEVNWTSSNTNIATVDGTGKVTSVGIGACVITATSKVDSSLKASCNVAVEEIKVTSITLNKTSYTFTDRTPLQLVATILPENATNKEVTWESTSPGNLIVDRNGKVTPSTNQGGGMIIARAKDGSGKVATCNITINIGGSATYKKGDINKDGKVTVMDVRYGLKALTKGTITDEEIKIGDVNGDNKFSVMDARKILRYIVGKIPSLD